MKRLLLLIALASCAKAPPFNAHDAGRHHLNVGDRFLSVQNEAGSEVCWIAVALDGGAEPHGFDKMECYNLIHQSLLNCRKDL